MSTTPRTDRMFHNWVSDRDNNGTYTLDLLADQTRQFFDEISELETELTALNNRVAEFKQHEILLRNEVADLNTTLSQMRIAEDAWLLERDALRADLERFTGHGLLDCHAICDQRDAAVQELDAIKRSILDLSHPNIVELLNAERLARVQLDEARKERDRWHEVATGLYRLLEKDGYRMSHGAKKHPEMPPICG